MKQISADATDAIKKLLMKRIRKLINPERMSAEEYAGCPISDPNFKSCLEDGIVEELGYEQSTLEDIYEEARELGIELPDEKEIAFPELKKPTKVK